MRFRITVDGEAHEIEVEGPTSAPTVRVDGAPYQIRVKQDSGDFEIRVGRDRYRVTLHGSLVFVDGAPHEVFTEALGASGESSMASASSRAAAVLEIRPPMPGRVVKLLILVGGAIKKGQTLAILEAMKMQNEIPAPADAIVRSVGVREGESISADRVIAVLETR